jgi:hypothetical protein
LRTQGDRNQLLQHVASAPNTDTATKVARKWKHKEGQILRQIERLETEISELDRERERVVPIIEQLDAFASRNPELHAFRRDDRAAQRRGARIVFSFLGNKPAERAGSLLISWILPTMLGSFSCIRRCNSCETAHFC